ncbi:Putative ribonuclease H protein At1g65750 [Linum perenne]
MLFLASIPRSHFTEGPPYISWSLQSDGIFSVASLRRSLVANLFFGSPNFPHKFIWQPATPSKVACFIWRVFLRKIATQDNLQNRGFYMVNRCVLCSASLESIDHLLLTCPFSSDIWLRFSSRLSIHGPFSSSIEAFILEWKGLNCAQSLNGDVMKVLLHAVFWFIWKERNDRIFKDKSESSLTVFRRIWLAVEDWLLADRSFSSSDSLGWRRLIFDNG